MESRKQLNDLREAQKRRREEQAKLFASRRPAAPSTPPPRRAKRKAAAQRLEPEPPPPVVPRTRDALIALFRDEGRQPSAPSSALVSLADLYLHAAQHRSRHLAMVWPASLKTLTLVHALATLARWHEGDKQGVRGLLFPVKTNAFHSLNHIHFDRPSILRIANDLFEGNSDATITRHMPDKDPFFFSLSDRSLPQIPGEMFNPTIGELLPHFLATPGFSGWGSCDSRLLGLIRAKLIRRAHARALGTNCAVIGAPASAPDALFALDGRMSESELRQACRALAKLGAPEVVLVQATRAIRLEASGWKGRLVRFSLMLEEIFRDKPPGVIVVTDDPYVAFRLNDDLWEQNLKREPERRWNTPHEYRISGVPSSVDGDGLLPAGGQETLHPVPREFDVHVVDMDVAKVASKLARIANASPAGKIAADSLVQAASFLSRLAALPCGVRHMSEYLAAPEISSRTRAAFDWPAHLGAVHEFDRSGGLGDKRTSVMECLDRGSKLFTNYFEATPFAHKLASIIAHAAAGKKRNVTVVFTGALYRSLAERFLVEYGQYPGGLAYNTFQERVHLVSAAHLEEHLDAQQSSSLVFAGLNEDSLRVLLTDDRVPAHSTVLLTQRASQFLRATLNSIVERMPEFKSYKPRMESILRQLKDVPEDASVLSTGSYALPTFRVELSSDAVAKDHEIPQDSWVIRFDSGSVQYRRDTAEVYVYDPASQYASDAGFRACQVRSLEIGDRMFVMSTELREMVEQVLRDAGLPIQQDKTFEAALRSYHEQVQIHLAQRFTQITLSEKVRAIREKILQLDPNQEKDLPGPQAMRQWIDLGRSPDTPFDELRPQAPLREPTFKAFAQVLGFSPLEAAYQWQRVILAVRNSRRLDGRHVSDIYEYMLLQPESAMANSNIKRRMLTQLFDEARDNLFTVEYAGPLKESL